MNTLKEQIILLRDLEKTKEKLAHTEGFTIKGVFHKFDDNGSGAITLKEFKSSLNLMGVTCNEKEVFLVMRRKSKDVERLK